VAQRALSRVRETETDLLVAQVRTLVPVLEIEKIKPSPGVRRARKEQVVGRCVRTSKIWNL
jgi:hypothetical protein